MNKLTIPALLLGVVMVAGAFAFMPVQEASTVHTSTAGAPMQLKTTTDTELTVTAGQVVTIDVGAPFTIVTISFKCTSADPSATALDTECTVGENMDVDTYKRDSETTAQTVTLTAIAGLDATATRVLFIDGDAAAAATDLLNLSAANDIAFTMVNDITATDAGDNGYTLTVEVVIEVAANITFDATDISFT